MASLYQQIRSNLVAIISLLVALSTLGYTTWRHQVSEVNRTTREAAFEILRTAEALQSVVDFAHYEMDTQAGHPIKGWEKVLYLRDMAALMPPSVNMRTEQLRAVWAQDSDNLVSDEAATRRVTAAIENLRTDVRAQLSSLR
ncbi:MAG: hypothetical protein ABL892_09475 [Thiobacillaceae bacterium]